MPSESILAKKQEEVRKIADKYKDAKTIVFVDYLGLTVAQDTGFRTDMRSRNIDYKVLKNRMLTFVFKEIGIEGIGDMLQGPTALAMSTEDHVVPAKICADAEKRYKVFGIKGGIMDGKVVSADDIRTLASLPSQEQLIARVLGGFNAPVAGLVNVLSANLRGLVRALNAIAENK